MHGSEWLVKLAGQRDDVLCSQSSVAAGLVRIGLTSWPSEMFKSTS